MVPSVAWASRTVSAIVGMKRASTNSCHPHADGELVSVAIVRTSSTLLGPRKLTAHIRLSSAALSAPH